MTLQERKANTDKRIMEVKVRISDLSSSVETLSANLNALVGQGMLLDELIKEQDES